MVFFAEHLEAAFPIQIKICVLVEQELGIEWE